MKQVINTDKAPAAVGSYSQAIRFAQTVYISGQLPIAPEDIALCSDDPALQIEQVIKNVSAVCEAAGGGLKDIVKLNVFLIDLTHVSLVNEAMSHHFPKPWPARASIGVKALPKDALVEMDAIMVLPVES